MPCLAVAADRTPLREQDIADRVRELQDHISALEQGSADVLVLKKLALLCAQTLVPSEEPTSPLSPAFSVPLTPSPLIGSSQALSFLASDLWKQNKNIDRLLNALLEFLDPGKVSGSSWEECCTTLISAWPLLD